MLNQNFPESTLIKNIGVAHKLPITQTHDLYIGFPWPNLSHNNPTKTGDERPQVTIIKEYNRANTYCYFGKVCMKYIGKW